MVKEVSDQDFQEVVLGSDIPVLVDFWAPWCGPCHMVSPVIEKLSKDYADDFKFCKVNVDEAPKIAQNYRITSIPTLIFFKKKGQKADQIVGAVPESEIKSMMEALL
jgi:thioredoxin 1